MEKDGENLIAWAAREAEAFLLPSCNRWKHIQGVVQQACLSDLFGEEDHGDSAPTPVAFVWRNRLSREELSETK